MNVSRSHWVTIKQFQENTGWSIGGQRVGSWVKTVEVILSVLIGSELSSQVVIGLVLRVLEIVFSVGRCLPDVNDCVWNWLLSDQIGNGSVHQSSLSACRYWVLDDATAKWSEWGVGAPERTEN